jgi:mono/diheme cytochrome c family protein
MAGSRRWSGQAIWGAALIAGGVVILIVFLALTLPSGGPLRPGSTSGGSLTAIELGRRIYTTGVDEDGRVIRRSAIMMFGRAACAQCHGADARGRKISSMMGSFEAPDIRWSTLSRPMQEENGALEPAYDAATFGKALREGIDSAGDTLEAPMPRWDLTDAQVEALIAFLKTK